MRRYLIVSFVIACSSSAAWADDCKDGDLVTYYKPEKLPTSLDTRCDLKKGKCEKLEMRGFLYPPVERADHKGKHAIIIYNHGSGATPGAACEESRYFSNLGYLVFVPHRRGVGKSTGVGPGDYNKDYCSKKGDPGFCKMEYLEKQIEDVATAIEFAKKQPGVDGDKLILMGHSFGGIVTLFANDRDLGQRAVVDLAGGSQSWEGNPDAVEQLKRAVEKAVTPIFFVEPLNDQSIGPNIELPRVAGRNCRQYETLTYAAVDTNGDGVIDLKDYDPPDNRDKAHVGSMKATDQWGPAADEFMNRYLNHPAKPFDHLCQNHSIKLD